MLLKSFASAACLAALVLPVQAEIKITSDLPPVASLVAMVAKDVFTPEVFMPTGGSAHTTSISMSQIRAINAADGFIILGGDILPQLHELLMEDYPDKPVLQLVKSEKGHDGHDDHHEEHAQDDHEHAHHSETGADPHHWLDPVQTREWPERIAQMLGEMDPKNAHTYHENAHEAEEKISALTAQIHTKNLDQAQRRFAVTHDAYGHFQQKFGIKPPLRLGDAHGHGVGAQSIAEVQKAMATGEVACIMVDHLPANSSAQRLAQRFSIPIVYANPLRTEDGISDQSYLALISHIADQFEKCFE